MTILDKKYLEWLKIPNSDVLVTALTRIFTVLLGFCASILTARFLGPAGRGQFFFVITLAATMTQFGNLGLHASNTYSVAKNKSLIGGLLANSFWISIMAGFVCFVVALLMLKMTRWFQTTPALHLWFAVLFVPPLLFYLLGGNLLVGINRIKLFNLFEAGSRLLNLIGLFWAGYFTLNVTGFLGVNLLTTVFSVGALLVFLFHFHGNGLGFRGKLFQTNLCYAIKAYFIALTGFLVLRSNVFLLQSLSNASQTGYYSIAVNITDVLGIIPASAGLVLFPNLVSREQERWKTTLKNLYSVGALMLITCTVTVLVARPFIITVFGAAYKPSIPILLRMLPGVFFLGISTIVSQYLAAIGFPRSLLVIWSFIFALNAVFGLVFIPMYAGMGAAMAFSLAYILLFGAVFGLAWMKERQMQSTINK